MSQYLRISSKGEAQVESFTVLGASSARGDENKIGQFGSGAKHAILCALRKGLQIVVYCGKTKIVPQTVPQTIHGVMQERVLFRVGNKTEQSSMTLDFGSLDWTDAVPMMVRELISNALDSVGNDWNNVIIEYTEKPRAKSGYTSVFVELTEEVREVLAGLHHMFLHVHGEQNKKLLPQNPMNCRFYRKGVFVHEVNTKSLYSYNCGDELEIDESRNLNAYAVQSHCARLLSEDIEATENVLVKIIGGDTDFYEAGFLSWYINRRNAAKALRKRYGKDVSVCDNPVTLQRAKSKSINAVLISGANGWFDACQSGGIPLAVSKLGKADADGLTTFEASEECVENVLVIWDCLQELGLTGSLECPNVMEFEQPMSCGSVVSGFYCSQTESIYIHRDSVNSWQVIIEELAHCITKANDETRYFQDYAFRLSALLMRKLLNK